MAGDIMMGIMQDGLFDNTNKAEFGDIPGTGIVGEMQVGIMETTLYGEMPAPVQCGIIETGLIGDMHGGIFGQIQTGITGEIQAGVMGNMPCDYGHMETGYRGDILMG